MKQVAHCATRSSVEQRSAVTKCGPSCVAGVASIDHKFRHAIQGSAIGVAVADRSRRLVLVNPAFCRITGYAEQELLAMEWPSLTHRADRVKNLALARRMLAGKLRSFLIEKRYITKSGQCVWVRNSTCILEEKQGKPITFLALVEDITELKRAETELRRLSTWLLNLQYRERRRIARELHDTTAQNTAGQVMALANLKKAGRRLDDAFRRELESASQLAKQITQEIRTASYLLHPPLLDELGVVHAMRWYIQGFSQRSGIEVGLELPNNMRRLPAEIETALFRVVQESLNNVRRHSGSARATVRLQRTRDEIRLLVRDFGKGMTTARNGNDPVALGVGIPGMRERMRQFGGELQIRANQSGTLLEAVIPLRIAPTTKN